MTLLWDNIRFALMAIWTNRIRTLLTMLGIIIGVFSVITLVSIGNGVQKEFTGAVQSFGATFGAVVSGDLENGGNPSSFVSLSSLTMHDVEVIAAVPTVRHVAPTMIVPGTVTPPGRTPTLPMVVATNDAFDDIANLTIRAGRSFDPADVTERRRVLIVGQDAAASDFTGDPVGQQVTILDTVFEVVGVFGTDNALYGGEGFLGNSAPNMNAAYVVPITTTQELIDTLNIFRILFAFDQPEDVQPGVAAIEQRLLENHKGIKDFSVLTSDDLLELFDQFFGILTDAVAGIAAISLIVGGIGIMNIMLVSVTERTKEIGIRKAVGAADGSILIQFLVEAATVSLVGGGIGFVLSLVAGAVISTRFHIPTDTSFSTVLLALGMSVGIGVLFGLIPATTAARKNPIDALRYE